VRKMAAPLGPLGKNAGNNGVFPEAQGAPLGPLGKFKGNPDVSAGALKLLTVLKALEALIPDPSPGVPGRRKRERSSEKGMCALRAKTLRLLRPLRISRGFCLFLKGRTLRLLRPLQNACFEPGDDLRINGYVIA
jgi:hypothetical protein